MHWKGDKRCFEEDRFCVNSWGRAKKKTLPECRQGLFPYIVVFIDFIAQNVYTIIEKLCKHGGVLIWQMQDIFNMIIPVFRC